MFGLAPTTVILISPVLILAWSFQAYWGVRTFFDAKEDIQKGSKVSEWLYARFTTPIAVALFLAFAAFESVMQGGSMSWGTYSIVGSLLLLWPSIIIVISIRTYELVKNWTSKTT